MPTIAFVTPWYGRIPGGAEAEARRTAEHLAAAGQTVEVLTTCIRDFHADWGKNHHRPGTTNENGVTVRRFKVKKRDKAAFDRVNLQLMNGLPVSAADEQTYINQMINCPALYQFIADHREQYIFIFIPYMFATTHHGVQIAPERSIVIPCLHDEIYARMGIYKQSLTQAAALVFHVEAEKRLADSIFGESEQVRLVLGEGVDTNITADASRFRQKYGIEGAFAIYVGRREPGKNTPLLFEYWTRYQNERDNDKRLLLLGSGDKQIPKTAVNLGFLPREDVYDAMAAAAVLIMPSVNESFSLVLMESWLAGTAVLVHAACAVTKEHVQRSNGGLYFADYSEFAATLDYLFAHPETAGQMGRSGKAYVLGNYEWGTIVGRYVDLIAAVG